MEVVPEEAQSGPRQGGEDQGPRRPVGELGGDEEEAHGAHVGHAARQAVQPVHEVQGVGDAYHPEPGEEEAQGGVQRRAEGGFKADAHRHEEEGRQGLDEETEEGGKAELVVHEAHQHQPGPSQEDGQDLDEDPLHQDGPQEGRRHQGQDHAGVQGEPPSVGKGFTVQAPLVGQVSPAHLEGEAAHMGDEAPGEEEGHQEDEDHREPAPACGLGDADALKNLAHLVP